jgi:hypothetical protein
MRRPTQEAADIVVIAIMPSAPGLAIVRCTVTGQERRRTGDRGIPYLDTIIRRWQRQTNLEAVRVETGETFNSRDNARGQ